MTEKVLVTIKGLQFESVDYEQEAIEVINVGQLSEINGKIYIKYDEVMQGEHEFTSNLIKIDKDSVEITKKGVITAHMQFKENQKTLTCYQTEFGSIYLGVFSRSVEVAKKNGNILIDIDYSLEVDYENISDCKVRIEIKPTK